MSELSVYGRSREAVSYARVPLRKTVSFSHLAYLDGMRTSTQQHTCVLMLCVIIIIIGYVSIDDGTSLNGIEHHH